MRRSRFASRMIAVFLIGQVSTSCKKEPLKLLCSPTAPYGDKVALELDEDGGKAKLLDPYSLLTVDPNPFVDVYFSPTTISLQEKERPNFWLLDRQTGKLHRNSPFAEYYCSSGRRF